MNGTKYIVMENDFNLRLYIIPKGMSHSDMYNMVKNFYPGLKLTSAGFMNERHECYGESFTLDISSNQERDTRLAKNLFHF